MENERGTHDSNFLLIQRNPQHVQGKKGLLRQKQDLKNLLPDLSFPTALVVFCIVLSGKKTSFLRLLFFADFPLQRPEKGVLRLCLVKVEDSILFLPGKP